MALFPVLAPVQGVPLLVYPAAGSVVLLLLSLLALRMYKRHLLDYVASPGYAIKQLARRTREFGVAYAELQFGRLLGKGSQGEVFAAQWRGLTVAVKKIDTRAVPDEIVDEFVQEADMMRRLRHPCLCLFLGVSLEHPHLCIVTECVRRGSLFDILQEEAAGFTWRRALQIMTDIARSDTIPTPRGQRSAAQRSRDAHASISIGMRTDRHTSPGERKTRASPHLPATRSTRLIILALCTAPHASVVVLPPRDLLRSARPLRSGPDLCVGARAGSFVVV